MNSIASTEFENEEEIVFNAVQDYLNENKIVEKNNLVNYIKSYFSKIAININEEGIVKNLESLIEKKRIVEGSKLTRNTVLQNEKRKKIYDCIVNNPGMYFNKILKNMNLSNHVVYWHVNILLKFNLIKTTEIQNRDIYFNSDFDVKEAKTQYILRKKGSKKILEYLKENTIGINKNQLASELKMHAKTIKKYVDLLEEYGFIEKKKFSPKEILYFLK